MKLKTVIPSTALALAALGAASMASATTYKGVQNIDGNTVDISITTDGTLGRILSTDITAFDVSVSGPVGTFDMNSDDPNAQVDTSANNIVTATSTSLTTLVNANGGEFYAIDAYTSDFGYFCVGGRCGINGDIVGQSVGLYAYSNDAPINGEASVTDPDGTIVTLGTVSAAPEPSAWTLMIAGVGVAGGMLRNRSRRPLPSTVGA